METRDAKNRKNWGGGEQSRSQEPIECFLFVSTLGLFLTQLTSNPLSPRKPFLPPPDVLCTEYLPTSLDPFLRVVFDPFSPIVDTQEAKSYVLFSIHHTCVLVSPSLSLRKVATSPTFVSTQCRRSVFRLCRPLGPLSVQSLCHVRLCDPMNCSRPGFPVHHQLLELAQTHVH